MTSFEYLQSLLKEIKIEIKDLLYQYLTYGGNLTLITDIMYKIRVLETIIMQTETKHDNEIAEIKTSIINIDKSLRQLKTYE